MPKFVYLIGALGLFLFAKNITTTRLQIVWSIRLLSYFLIYFPIFLWIRPKFTNIKERIREIWTYNRSFGFPMYSGSLFSVGLNALTGVLISYFSIDNVGVGFFGLALILSQPLSFIPNVIATTHYKDFSKQNEIPRKLIVVTIGMCFVALIVLRMLIAPFITFFYSEEFIPVINLSFIVSIGVLLYGFADFFNRFLGAHGKGKELRNSSIIIGIILMITNLTLIPKYGETGAAYTKILAGVIYISLMLYYYIKVKNKIMRGTDVEK
jgi:O-antigen/teichoic acid export membrane protein